MYLVSTAVCTCVSFSMCACFQKLGSDWQKHMTIMCVLCTHLWIILCIWPLKEEYHSHLKMHGKGRHNNAIWCNAINSEANQKSGGHLSWSCTTSWRWSASDDQEDEYKAVLCDQHINEGHTRWRVCTDNLSFAVLPCPWNWDSLLCSSGCFWLD